MIIPLNWLEQLHCNGKKGSEFPTSDEIITESSKKLLFPSKYTTFIKNNCITNAMESLAFRLENHRLIYRGASLETTWAPRGLVVEEFELCQKLHINQRQKRFKLGFCPVISDWFEREYDNLLIRSLSLFQARVTRGWCRINPGAERRLETEWSTYRLLYQRSRRALDFS